MPQDSRLTSLVDRLRSRGSLLFLCPIPNDQIAAVRFRLELARLDYALVPMGSMAVHVLSDSPDLARHMRGLVSTLPPEYAPALFGLADGCVELSEGWAAMAARGTAGGQALTSSDAEVLI